MELSNKNDFYDFKLQRLHLTISSIQLQSNVQKSKEVFVIEKQIDKGTTRMWKKYNSTHIEGNRQITIENKD